MNKNMNIPQLQKLMMEFEKQNEKMEMTSDMMGDAMDDAFEVRQEPPCLKCLKCGSSCHGGGG